MTTTIKKLVFSALAAAIVITGVAATPSKAANNGINALANVAQIKANTANEAASQGAGNQFSTQQGGGTAGPRTGSDRIDLSVCELGTFDFDKCLN